MGTDQAPPGDFPAVRVALDVGPLYGHRTGVGVAAAGILAALAARPDVAVAPYLTSARATPRPGHRRLPVPGIIASHVWSRLDVPSAERWLPPSDVLHGTNYVAPPSRRPTVVSVYDCWFLRHPEQATALVRRAGANLRRAVARGAWVHVTSDATRSQAIELLDTDRVVTVHLGAPDAPPEIAVAPPAVAGLRDRPVIVAIATEERRKGLPLLVQAFDLLPVDDAHLVIAGAPGDDSVRLAEAIAASRAGGRIHRLGPVDGATKAWLLRNATVLAYPSLDEGFGFPILEANAAGTPVVATAVGSIPEVAGDAAVLVDDAAPESLAAALADVLAGRDRAELVAAGHRNVRRFRWATTAEQLVGLYRTAIDERSRR